ncbi:MAG: hypothetical protein HY906_02985 [Deltaproteobacteria bacterium]|nr:hypothetical protein [Deltaproteobacteria bacterium]
MRAVAFLACWVSLGCGGTAQPAADAQVPARPVDLLVVLGVPGDTVGLRESVAGPLSEAIMAELGGRALDVRLGVVTSNLGDFGQGWGCEGASGNTDGDGARLLLPYCQPYGLLCDGYCDPETLLGVATWPPWLDLGDLMGRGVDRLGGVIACVANGSAGGYFQCYVHQPLEAALRALDANPGFLRDGSVLGLLIITPIEDFSTSDSRLWGPDYRPETNCFFGYRSEDLLVPVDEYVGRLVELAAARPVVVGVDAVSGELVVDPAYPGSGCPDGMIGQAGTCRARALVGQSGYAAPRLYALMGSIEAQGRRELRAVPMDFCSEDPASEFRRFLAAVVEASSQPDP